MAFDQSHTPSHANGDAHQLDELSDKLPESPADLERGSSRDNNEKLDERPGEAAAEAEAQPTGPPSAPSGPPGGPPPNGGLVAWLQILGGWMLFFNTWVSFATLLKLAELTMP